MVGKVPEQPAPDRSHNKAYGKQNRGVELLHDRIIAGKERAREVEREGGEGIEVIPFHQVAHRADEDGLEPPADISSLVEMILAKHARCRSHLCTRLSPLPRCGKLTTPAIRRCFRGAEQRARGPKIAPPTPGAIGMDPRASAYRSRG